MKILMFAEQSSEFVGKFSHHLRFFSRGKGIAFSSEISLNFWGGKCKNNFIFFINFIIPKSLCFNFRMSTKKQRLVGRLVRLMIVNSKQTKSK